MGTKSENLSYIKSQKENEIKNTQYDIVKNTNEDDSLNSNLESNSFGIKNHPKLIISDYTISPKMVEAGQNFDLSFTIYNTNDEHAAYNIKITLDQDSLDTNINPAGIDENNSLVSSGNIFTPVGSSNSFYTSAIYAGNVSYKSSKMNVLPNAKAGSYKIKVLLEYEDYLGNEYTSKETIGIPVVQKAEITTDDIVHDDLIKDQASSFDMNIYNTGKDNLSRFMLTVEGDGFTTEDSTHFIGNFASGSSDNFSFNLTPTKEGPLNGKIIITYEDSTGKTHKEEKEFNAQVEKMATSDENGNPIDPVTGQVIVEEGAFSSIPTPVFLLIPLIILAIIIVLIKKRKKKKDEKDLYIDEN